MGALYVSFSIQTKTGESFLLISQNDTNFLLFLSRYAFIIEKAFLKYHRLFQLIALENSPCSGSAGSAEL